MSSVKLLVLSSKSDFRDQEAGIRVSLGENPGPIGSTQREVNASAWNQSV